MRHTWTAAGFIALAVVTGLLNQPTSALKVQASVLDVSCRGMCGELYKLKYRNKTADGGVSWCYCYNSCGDHKECCPDYKAERATEPTRTPPAEGAMPPWQRSSL